MSSGRPPFVMIESRFFSNRLNVSAGFRGMWVNLAVRILVSAGRLDGDDGAEEGELRGRAASPMAIARVIGAVGEWGRDGGEAFVREGLKEAVQAGLLTWDEGAERIGIVDWQLWSTNPLEVRRRKDRERKRRDRSADRSTQDRQVSAELPQPVRGQQAPIRGQVAEVVESSAEPDLDRVDRVDPPDRQDPLQEILADEPVGGDKTRAAVATLRVIAKREHAAGAAAFVRWFGQRRCEVTGTQSSSAAWRRVASKEGVKRWRRVLDLYDVFEELPWDEYKRLLFAGAEALLADPDFNGQNGKVYLDVGKHLCRDREQLERRAAEGKNMRPKSGRSHGAAAVGADQRQAVDVKIGGTGW